MGSEWREGELGELVRLQRGHDLTAAARTEGPHPVMGSAGQNGTHVVAKASGPGVVIGRSGGSVGRVHYCAVNYWPHNTCLYVTDFLGNHPKFVYYLLGTLRLADYNSGSAQPSLNRNFIYTKVVSVPSLQTQVEIASLLGALDDRIELLRQTNTTLEAIAKALFKSWFVDFDPVCAKAEGLTPAGIDADTAALFPSEFEESELGLIPKGWRNSRLGEICQNIRRQAKPEQLDADTPYIGLEHMPRGSIALAEAGTAGGLASGKFWYARNDVLFGKLRPYFHKVGVASHTGVCSTDILVIRVNDEAWFGYATMQLSSDAIIAHATRLSNGAKMPRSSWNDIANYPVVLPAAPLAAAFDGLVRSFIEKIHKNIEAATSLAELRDTLLPRLISGKLRLPEAEAMIKDAVA